MTGAYSRGYKKVSHQKARSLLTRFHGRGRRLPQPGREIRLDDQAVLVNWGGQYEVHMR
jgi:hypothetical protein